MSPSCSATPRPPITQSIYQHTRRDRLAAAETIGEAILGE
jgi:hypothetical protein